MTRAAEFQPDWASPPGATVADILASQHRSATDLAEDTGISIARVRGLLRGTGRINAALAERLEEALGPSVQFWMRRERQYRNSLARKALTDEPLDARALLARMPLADMRRFGWIEVVSTKAAEVSACLRFFDVPDATAWLARYRSELSVAAFRTSPTFEANPYSVAVWLRQAEIASAKIDCQLWNRQTFVAMLPEIKSLSRIKNPDRFLPQLRAKCASCGVAVVIVRAPKGCRASGATRFLSPNKALIVLSVRYRTDDHFWFTFFHEAGHLILHAEDALFLEDESDVTETEEAEADAFAANALIPKEHVADLMKLPPNLKTIIAFARRVGVSPGIIVGQLQHLGRVRRDRLNGLKRRYSWADVSTVRLNP